MRAIPVIVAVVLGLTGCSGMHRPYTAPDVDGVACSSPGASERVYIDIRYAGNGTPSAHPDECSVDPGTWVTWRGPPGSEESFGLAFPGGSPGGRGEPPRLMSRPTDGRDKVAIRVGDTPGRYKYDISANGIVVDPAIIIRN